MKMSVKTIYTCDKCNKEQETKEQFWSVGVVANHNHERKTSEGYTTYVADMSMQVCRSCLESFGIYVMKKKDVVVTEPIPEPTLEDRIKELVELTLDDRGL